MVLNAELILRSILSAYEVADQALDGIGHRPIVPVVARDFGDPEIREN